MDVLREGKGRDAVDDAEVDGLGAAALELCHLRERDAEDLRGGDGVDVLAVQKSLLHDLVAADVGEQAQLDLAVVRVDQHAAARGDEHFPYLRAELGADRDVLQIRLGGGEPPRRRDGHLKARVDAPVRADDLAEPVGIGGFEL